ncbi:MAG: phospholipase [Gammaproteobacteria bacterium]|nr:MAG: phospholipase [Gammaproteobacteria bacterium]
MHRSLLLTLLAGLILIAGCAARHGWVLAPGQHPQSFERRVTVETHGRFLLYLPAAFDPSGRTRYPLLIFLHGSGESGEDLEKVKVHGPPKLVASKPDFPFIVASPQARNHIERFDPATLDAMLDELLEQLPVDPDRIYLTGLSMGGIWTYGWAIRHPERFAAIAPVCGLWDPGDACRLKDVPVWAFHGAQDPVVPLDGDQAMIDAIKACGGDARLTVYLYTGHDSWNQAYADPEPYTCLLQQRRRAVRKP